MRRKSRARLTQIGGGVKQPAVLGDGVAVGHAGDEIGDEPGAAALIETVRGGVPGLGAMAAGSAR